jgi:hypothetical protein
VHAILSTPQHGGESVFSLNEPAKRRNQNKAETLSIDCTYVEFCNDLSRTGYKANGPVGGDVANVLYSCSFFF